MYYIYIYTHTYTYTYQDIQTIGSMIMPKKGVANALATKARCG